MKDTQGQLEDQFSFFELHLSRLKCLCFLVSGLLQLRTVNLRILSLSFPEKSKASSSYRRIQRFLASFSFPLDRLSRFVWDHFIGQAPIVLAIDRTNWKLGRSNINILMLSICREGFAVPLMWKVLGNKRGNSSQKERIELMKRFLKVISPDQQIHLVADREFLGEEWINWLDYNYIHFVIRIRSNQLIEHSGRNAQRASSVFSSETWKGLRKKRWIKGSEVYMGGQKLKQSRGKKADYLILISNLPIKTAKCLYARRWGIEVLFGELKSRGFNFEDTHITIPDRIENLIALLTMAHIWAVKTGLWIIKQTKEIPIKKHGRKAISILAISIFRIGLDLIQQKLLNNSDLQYLVNLLSCT